MPLGPLVKSDNSASNNTLKKNEELSDCLQVIEEFKYAVVPRLDELERGVIHGDVNEMNILVAHKPGGR